MIEWQVTYDPGQDHGAIVLKGDAAWGASIQFQHGPIQENGINGVQNEQLLELLIMRTEQLDLRMPCVENAEAIECMKAALAAFNVRTEKRRAQGVEGTERPHSNTEEMISE